MNRVDYLIAYDDIGPFSEKAAVYAALVSCLTPEEACSCLSFNFEQPYPKRQVILKKIASDLQANYLACHQDLVSALLSLVEFPPHRRAKACAQCLAQLFNSLPTDVQAAITKLFLKSKYGEIRKRGYKNLLLSWSQEFQSIVDEAWTRYREFDAARVIINNFPVEFLEGHRSDLQEVVYGTAFLARLYLRVAVKTPELLERLSEIDEISFAYVSAKLRMPISPRAGLAMFERNKFDKRLGLLIWSFGQLKLWSVLEQIAPRIDRVLEEAILYRHHQRVS